VRRGKVVTWKPGDGKGSGYGFIKPALPGPDVFCHISVAERCGVALKVGDRVRFDVEMTQRGWQVSQIELVDV
jgi:cold shock CspA family protein